MFRHLQWHLSASQPSYALSRLSLFVCVQWGRHSLSKFEAAHQHHHPGALLCLADPFKNDQNFILSMLTLEELGATGNKGLIGILTNPVLANAVAGLATSATAQATIERNLLWDRRTSIIEPFGETAQQVFARISAYRDSMDGDQVRCDLRLPAECTPVVYAGTCSKHATSGVRPLQACSSGD